jgi:hypothetical protein
MNKHKIALGVGFAGGGVFFVLNLATQGAVPGGAQGGFAGFIIGYVLTRLVLALVPARQ